MNKTNTKWDKVQYLITPTAIAFALIKQHGVESATEIIGHMIGDNDEAALRVGRALRVYRHKLGKVA